MDSAISPPNERERAAQQVDRFVRRFQSSYRRLAYYAALPLVITPELLNYLRNQFLRAEGVPWVAEVDLLLSDLCRPVGYEQYAMDAAVRAHLLSDMEAVLGKPQIEAASRLLLSYVQHLAQTNPYLGQREVESQQLAAMVCLDEYRQEAVRRIAESFQQAAGSVAGDGRVEYPRADRAEMLRLAWLTQELSSQLEQHPELVEYARLLSKVIIDPSQIKTEELSRLHQPQRVLDLELPNLSNVIPGLPRPSPPIRDGRQRVRPLAIGVAVSRADVPMSGTLGCFVRKRGKPDLMILSCNQVLANYNQGTIGDPIIQPGLYFGGNPEHDRIATLVDFIPLQLEGNRADAAIALLDPEITANLTELPGVGVLQGVYLKQLKPSMEVAIVGCTATKWGQIRTFDIDHLEIVGGYPQGKCSFDGVIKIELSLEDDEPLVQGGNSGALVVDRQGYAVGLVFAGVQAGRRHQLIAAPIQTVLDALDLELALTLDSSVTYPPLQEFEFEVATIALEPEDTALQILDIQLHEFNFETAKIIDVQPSAPLNAPNTMDWIDTAVLRESSQRLTQLEQIVLAGALQGKTYQEIAALAPEHDESYIKRTVGPNLWKRLTAVLGERVTKQSLPTITRRWLEAQRVSIQREQRQGQQFVENLGNSITLAMVQIPGGSFLMGSPEDELDRYGHENPQHWVTVPPFLMGKYPVTQAQWKVVAALPQVNRELNPDPSRFKGENRPVEKVSWYDAVEFCDRLSQLTGRSYRLPTEAEWEYACRANPVARAGSFRAGDVVGSGTTPPFHFGKTITTDLANYNGNSTYGQGPKGIYRAETTSVGIFAANAFGLYDMHGNVWEWCLDHWHSNYEGAPTDGSAWVNQNAESTASRVLRGGSWNNDPRNCRSATRVYNNPANRGNNFGFRVVCSAPRTL